MVVSPPEAAAIHRGEGHGSDWQRSGAAVQSAERCQGREPAL